MLIHMVEQLTAVLCGYYQILHPCTELAGQVYSRLYGEYHVGLHGVGIYGAYIALFVASGRWSSMPMKWPSLWVKYSP